MIKNIIFLLLISFNSNSFGQNYTLTQLIQVYKKDSTLKTNQITALSSQVKLLQDNNKVTQDRLFALEHDSLALDSKFFAFINGKWTFVGVGNSQKWIDSVTSVLVQMSINTKQLFTNDQQLALTLSDSAKKAFIRWLGTDSITKTNRGALIGLGNQVSTAAKNIISIGVRIDSVVTNEIDYSIPIQGVQDSVNETNKNVEAVKSDADKIKAFLSTTFINFHQ